MFTFDEKHLAAAVLHPLYRRLTFASTHSKGIAHSYIREQIVDVLGVNNQDQTSLVEPVKKKHKSMEDQFADPDEIDTNDDIYKQLDPLPFWKEH